MVLGVVIDLGNAWVIGIATVVFGMVHAVAMSWALPHPQHQGSRLPLRTARLLGFLLVLAAATVVLGVLASEDGADHPVTAASVVVAVALVCGGPRVVATSR